MNGTSTNAGFTAATSSEASNTDLDDLNDELLAVPTVSQEDYDRIMAVLDVLVIVMESVSVMLTATSAVVYSLREMRCTTAVYLVAMNVADTVCGTLVALSNIWGYVGGPAAKKTLAYNYLVVAVTSYLSRSTRRSVYCFSVIVSVERFFVITFPLKARYFKIIKYPKLTVMALLLAVLSFHAYLPLKYRVTALATGGYRIGFTDNYRNNIATFEIVSNAAKFLFAYIPLVVSLPISLALFLSLRSHAHVRKTLQEVPKQDGKARQIQFAERQLAMTIWLSTFLFTVLSLPSNTVHLVSTYHSTFGYLKLDHRLYRLVSRISYLTLIASRYTSFCSYIGLSTAFRQNLLRGLVPRGLAVKLQR